MVGERQNGYGLALVVPHDGRGLGAVEEAADEDAGVGGGTGTGTKVSCSSGIKTFETLKERLKNGLMGGGCDC